MDTAQPLSPPSSAPARRLGRGAALALVLGWLFVPPLLAVIYVLIRSALAYDGMCPGLMDIQPYSCTLGEYIGRNTTSPFALAAWMMLGGIWFAFAIGVLAALALFRRFFTARTEAPAL